MILFQSIILINHHLSTPLSHLLFLTILSLRKMLSFVEGNIFFKGQSQKISSFWSDIPYIIKFIISYFLTFRTWTKINNFCSLIHLQTVPSGQDRKQKKKICFLTSTKTKLAPPTIHSVLLKNHPSYSLKPGPAANLGKSKLISSGKWSLPKKKIARRSILARTSISNTTKMNRNSLPFLTGNWWRSCKKPCSWSNRNRKRKNLLSTQVWSMLNHWAHTKNQPKDK